jgi:hypothetical protein
MAGLQKITVVNKKIANAIICGKIALNEIRFMVKKLCRQIKDKKSILH